MFTFPVSLYRGLSTAPAGSTFTYASNGDANGVCYYYGTNYGTQSWVNPHLAGRLTCSQSSAYLNDADYQFPAGLVDRDVSYKPATQNIAGSWFQLDLGSTYRLSCNYYSLRGRNQPTDHLRSWKLQGSNNASSWTDLDTQSNNTSINQSSWVSIPIASTLYYRYFRILQTGTGNSSTNILTLGEWEFYGNLI